MTAPQDPFGQPGEQPPGYGTPPPAGYGPPPGYAAPPPGYGQPSAYPPNPYAQQPFGQSPYGMAPYGGRQLASWGARVGASLIDMLLVLAIVVAGVIVSAVAAQGSEALGVIVLLLTYVGAIGFAIWQMAVQGRTGQTIGKKQLGIRLVRESDGQYVGAGLSIGRYFLHVVDQLPCYLGYFWPLWDDKKQTFADKILGTLVVKG